MESNFLKNSTQFWSGCKSTPFLYQICMILNRLFDPLWLDADVTLRGGGTAVLQEPLDKGDVIAVRLVDYYEKSDRQFYCILALSKELLFPQ